MISSETEYEKALHLLECLYRKGKLSPKASNKKKKVEAQVNDYEHRCAEEFSNNMEAS